jgi:hypothetical protein
VLKFYDFDVGQPLDAGTAEVSANYMGLVDLSDISVTLVEATAGDLIINEFLSDASVNGDPNEDGSFDPVEDEFIEIANVSDASVDLTGVTVWETDFPFLARHTFASGVLRAGESVVVFGGGDTSTLIGANTWFETAVNLDPGNAYGLNLTDAGDEITLLAADGITTITTLAYGDQDVTGLVPATTDASTNLDPDVWGSAYTDHPSATGATSDFSVGTWVDGSDFEGPDGRY